MWKVSQRQLARFPPLEQLRKLPRTGNAPVNIVSPELCDDVLQRLGPSLARHRSCDIIDINPGPGLWSSKVHDYVKPRKHILVEPEQGRNLPFLKPLLDAPKSRYSLVDWTGSEVWRLDEYVKQKLIPRREGLEEDGPEMKEPNDTLLILANLGIPSRTGESKLDIRRIKEFFTAIRGHVAFHSHGSVRMLVWVPDEGKSALLPRTVAHRVKRSVDAEMNAHIEEITGGNLELEVARESSIELASAKIVAQRMAERGIHIPITRRSRLQQEVQDAIAREHIDSTAAELNLEAEKGVRTPAWLEEFHLEAKFKTGDFKEFLEGVESETNFHHVKGQMAGPVDHRRTPQFLRLRKLRYTRLQRERAYETMDELLREQAAIDQIDLAIANGEHEGAARSAKLEEWERRTAQYMERLRMMGPNSEGKMEASYDDDRRAFARPSPLLMWDHRTAEPLIAKPDEFYPQHTLALLDIQPKPQTSSLLTSDKQAAYIEPILRHLFLIPTKSIQEALAGLVPGADEYLIPVVPALTDIRKGGCRNVQRMRCRMVTAEMVEALAMAWDRWPFKVPLRFTSMTKYRRLGV